MVYNPSKNLPVGQLYVPSIDDFKEVIDHILSTKNYTNNGSLLNKLEKELSLYLDVKYVVGVTNGTIGLMIALEALHKNGSILTPRFSFPATMNAICMIGASVCFCDTLRDSPNVCIKSLEEKLVNNNSISTILVPNLWSTLNNLDHILFLAKKYNVSLIYDSSQAFACSYKGKKISINGNAEVFSFHATKLITAFEGGCITTNDRSIYEKLTHIRSSSGAVGNIFKSKKIGNGRMSELQAGLCLRSLSKINTYIEHNKKIFMLYRELLKPKNRYVIFEPSNYKVESSYQYVVLILDQNFYSIRQKLIDYLISYKILARPYFNYDFSIFNDEKAINFLNSVNLSKSSICLPIGERIRSNDVIYISRKINKFFEFI